MVSSEDRRCLICHLGEEQQNLELLPCKQCNHPGIENKKYVHVSCMQTVINMQNADPVIQILDPDGVNGEGIPTCPYCQTKNLRLVHKIDWMPSIRNVIHHLPGIIWPLCLFYVLYIVSTMDIPPNLTLISPMNYRLAYLLFYLMIMQLYSLVTAKVAYAVVYAYNYFKIKWKYVLDLPGM